MEPPTIVYGEGTLDALRRRGITHLHFYCVGGRCRAWAWRTVEELIAAAGPGLTLVMLARRARCAVCGKRGAHVEPAPAPGRGGAGYRDWLAAERARCAAFLADTDEA